MCGCEIGLRAGCNRDALGRSLVIANLVLWILGITSALESRDQFLLRSDGRPSTICRGMAYTDEFVRIVPPPNLSSIIIAYL